MKQFWSHSGCKEKGVAGHSVKKFWKSWLAMLSLLLLLATGPSAWARSTWTVDSVLDTAGSASDGDHTLRWAVEQAADGDRIEFQSNLDGQTILLGSPIATGKNLDFMDWFIPVTLSAAPGNSGSLFQGSSGAVWNFNKVIIQGAQGAGVETDGLIGNFDATVTNNHGGGIRAKIIGNFLGTATQNSLTVENDAGASASGGGVNADFVANLWGGNVTSNTVNAWASTGPAVASGGGMKADFISKVTTDLYFDNNTASAVASTGGISASGDASAFGGGMWTHGIGNTDSGLLHFNGNRADALSGSGTARAEGGGLYLLETKNVNARFTDNLATASAGDSGNAVAAGGGMSGFLGGADVGVSAPKSFSANAARAYTQAGIASAYGGGLYAGQLDSIKGWYGENRAEAFSVSGLAEAYGGGAFVERVEKVSADFFHNTAQATAGDDGKAAAYGGAFAGRGDITIAGGTYFLNEAVATGADATAKGGALYLHNNGEQGSSTNVTFDASSDNIRFWFNTVTVNGKTTQNDVHFASDKAGDYSTDFTVTGKEHRSVSIEGGIHSEGAQGNTFNMVKKGDMVFNWGGVNVFEAMGGSTVSFAEGTSNIGGSFTADAVHGNLDLHLGANHTLNLNLNGRDNTQAFFSGLASLTLEEGSRFTISSYKAEPLSPWENLGKWLFAEGTGWSVDQLNTMGIMTSINGIWYSGGTFLTDAKGLWLNLEKLTNTSATPIPGAVWLLGSGLAGFAALRRRMKAA